MITTYRKTSLFHLPIPSHRHLRRLQHTLLQLLALGDLHAQTQEADAGEQELAVVPHVVDGDVVDPRSFIEGH